MDTHRDPAPPRRPPACPRASADVEQRSSHDRRRRAIATLLAIVPLITAAAVAHAGEIERRIDESLAFCAAADQLSPEQRVPVLARGLALADDAVALDERSVRAHFAVVCNLGKATSLGRVGFGTFGAVYRLRREVEITLTLAPNDPEALAAKGALLARLPRWLGGDRIAAEHWLQRALAVDPQNATARAYLDEIGSRPSCIAPAADTVITR